MAAKTARQIHAEMTERAAPLIGGLLGSSETRGIGEGGDEIVAAAVHGASRRMARQAAGRGLISGASAAERLADADRLATATVERNTLEQAAAEIRADWPEMSWEQAIEMAQAIGEDGGE
jgi:hypothetical protein